MPATRIETPPKAQVKPYEAASWNAQDANAHRQAINDHAKQLDKLVGPDELVLATALPAFTEADAEAILSFVQAQLDGRYVLVPPVPTPPSSYGKTLQASDNQANGIVAAFAGTQQLKLNVLTAVGGGNLTLQLRDSSDGTSVSAFDYASGYAGSYYLFVKKDGSTYEAQWPAADTTITV